MRLFWMANALAVIAFAPRGGLLHAPDTYMDKLAIGPGFEDGIVDLDKPADENAKALAKAKGVRIEDIVTATATGGQRLNNNPHEMQIVE